MKKFLTLIVFLIFSASLRAQVEHPVKWSYAAKKIDSKGAVVFLKATIEKGWHIYSQKFTKGGPIKTSFTFLPSKKYTLLGKTLEPQPISKYEPVLKADIAYFENEVVFQQKIKIHSSGPSTVKGKLEYTTCNDRRCNPSEEVEFNIPLSI